MSRVGNGAGTNAESQGSGNGAGRGTGRGEWRDRGGESKSFCGILDGGYDLFCIGMCVGLFYRSLCLVFCFLLFAFLCLVGWLLGWY
jgi:hypothetical protein